MAPHPSIRVAELGGWMETSLYGNGQLSARIDEIGEPTGETVSLSCEKRPADAIRSNPAGQQAAGGERSVGAFAPLFGSMVDWTALSIKPDADIALLHAEDRYAAVSEQDSAALSADRLPDADHGRGG